MSQIRNTNEHIACQLSNENIKIYEVNWAKEIANVLCYTQALIRISFGLYAIKETTHWEYL